MGITENRLKLGKKIKAIRLEHGMTQQQLALMIGISARYIGGIENGKYNVSYDKLVKIAEGFDISLEELFRGL